MQPKTLWGRGEVIKGIISTVVEWAIGRAGGTTSLTVEERFTKACICRQTRWENFRLGGPGLADRDPGTTMRLRKK